MFIWYALCSTHTLAQAHMRIPSKGLDPAATHISRRTFSWVTVASGEGSNSSLTMDHCCNPPP